MKSPLTRQSASCSQRRLAPAWLAALVALAATGCGAGGRPSENAPPVATTVAAEGEAEPTATAGGDDEALVANLERLRRRGEFEAYIDRALNIADEHPDSVAVRLVKTEALLAAGRHEEAENAARGAATLALGDGNPTLASYALKLWAIARFRQQRALGDPQVAALLAALPSDDLTVEMLSFWTAALGDRTAYRTSGMAGGRAEIQASRSAPGTAPDELNAIRAKINGVDAPLAFVDTGTQHTLLTVQAAKAAGVVVGPSSTRLVGFAKLNARPGVIESLQLGELVLHDVPVLVGDSPPLVALQGQMAIGTELMHHVRFTIDYPGRRVFVEPAARPNTTARRPLAQIPVWTFSQACLARGVLPDGSMARVLVDTGDHAGTFVSTRWARRNLPDFQRPVATVVFKFKQRNLKLRELGLGSHTLENWPIEDTLPGKLERLDTVDLLVGYDLLAPYEMTIDLQQRVLELYEPEPMLPAAEPRSAE